MNGIKSLNVDSSAFVRIKGGMCEQFRIDIGVRQGVIISPWLFNGWSDEGGEDGDGKEENELLGG